MFARKEKRILIWVFTVVLVFGSIIAIDRFMYKDRNVKLSDELDVFCTKVVKTKGVVILNDSLVISGNTFQIVDMSSYVVTEKDTDSYIYRPKTASYKPRIYDLDGPFLFRKEKANDTILIVKNGDSLYFKFLDLEMKDPSDPTFLDFLKS